MGQENRLDTGVIHRLGLPKGREFVGRAEARPLRPEPGLSYCHLETDASLNLRRFRLLEDELWGLVVGQRVVPETSVEKSRATDTAGRGLRTFVSDVVTVAD